MNYMWCWWFNSINGVCVIATKITHPLFCCFFTGGDEYEKSMVLDAIFFRSIVWVQD